MEMSNIQTELNEKISEIKRLQMELSRREDEDAGANTDNVKRMIITLEKENTNLKVDNLVLLYSCLLCKKSIMSKHIIKL